MEGNSGSQGVKVYTHTPVSKNELALAIGYSRSDHLTRQVKRFKLFDLYKWNIGFSEYKSMHTLPAKIANDIYYHFMGVSS